MRLMVTGAAGTLGFAVSRLAEMQDIDVFGTWHKNPLTGCANSLQLDLLDEANVMAVVSDLRPSVIVHAAISDQTPNMHKTMLATARSVCHAANHRGSRLIGFSSDMVFDGNSPPYPESAQPSPTLLYGQAKASADRYQLETVDNVLIIRTSLLYDFSEHNRQISWMLALIRADEKVPLFVDEIRQPMWVWNLAQIVIDLAFSSTTGLLNVAGPEAVNRLIYGRQLLHQIGIKPDKHVVGKLAAASVPGRPLNTRLGLDRMHRTLTTRTLSITESAEAWRTSGLWPTGFNKYQSVI